MNVILKERERPLTLDTAGELLEGGVAARLVPAVEAAAWVFVGPL
jgi:hypothetical protein